MNPVRTTRNVPSRAGETEHELRPIQGKKRQTREFLDPRTLPALPSMFRVLSTGEIEADSTACASAGFQVVHVRRTIEILGLNVRRLVRARQRKWRDLIDVYVGDLDGAGNRSSASAELALGEKGLPPFFTTARAFFGPFAETVLDEPPREWV